MPVTENSTHSAILVQWSPIRSISVIIFIAANYYFRIVVTGLSLDSRTLFWIVSFRNALVCIAKVFRYIRLTNLIPEILQMVDQGRIALTPAVELSYLKESEQRDLLETMESEDCTPSLSQSQQLKKLSQSGELDMDRIFELMRQPKANQEEKLRFDLKEIRRYFPKNYSTERIQQTILRLLEKYERNWRRERDAR